MDISEVKSSLYSISLETIGGIVEGVDHINQNINVLLKTRFGSDPLRPEFGCGVFERMDKPMNEVKSLLPNDVKKAIDLFIPEITVIKVTSTAVPGELTINTQWAFKGTGDNNIYKAETIYGIK